jgi:hypothetical protein
MSEYKHFIEKHFPNSAIVKTDNIELIYARICENNLITEIFEKYIIGNEYIKNCNYQIIFLRRYKNQLNRLLLYLPLNDLTCINFSLRATAEYLLKFIYSIYFDENLHSITRRKFRDLREGLNKVETDLFIDKAKINILFSYYGEFSNSIHDKIDIGQSQIEYMESIIECETLDLKSLDDKLLTILNNYQILICNIFKISEQTLSVAETVRLNNILSPKRLTKVRGHFYKV